MSPTEDRTQHRQRIDELLRQIESQRRQQLLLEAAGAQAPALERETEHTRQRLAELVQ